MRYVHCGECLVSFVSVCYKNSVHYVCVLCGVCLCEVCAECVCLFVLCCVAVWLVCTLNFVCDE